MGDVTTELHGLFWDKVSPPTLYEQRDQTKTEKQKQESALLENARNTQDHTKRKQEQARATHKEENSTDRVWDLWLHYLSCCFLKAKKVGLIHPRSFTHFTKEAVKNSLAQTKSRIVRSNLHQQKMPRPSLSQKCATLTFDL